MTLEINKGERVDFSKSTLHWGGPSKGIFKLVAVLTKEREGSFGSYITYGLGQSVMAGNMYVRKKLLKKPSYLFQVVGSSDEQCIYRTFIPTQESRKFPYWISKNKRTGDTYGDPLFDEFYMDIRKETAKTIYDYDEIEGLYRFNDFTAKVTLKNNVNVFTQMEFPINHINVMRKEKMWQVETGHILFPVPEYLNTNPIRLIPSFAHFNSLKSIDVFCDYPFGYRSKDMQNKGVYEDLSCEIELYAGIQN